MTAALEVWLGPIETLDVDAIVNPANAALAPGGGADGAIRRAAGAELDALLARAGGLSEGAAMVTPGFRLPARWIIHTVAPRWMNGRPEEHRTGLLWQCYQSCLEAADEIGLRSIAFPAIGAGAYGWPIGRASEVAVRATRAALERFTGFERVTFCCFSTADAAVYRAHLGQ